MQIREQEPTPRVSRPWLRLARVATLLAAFLNCATLVSMGFDVWRHFPIFATFGIVLALLFKKTPSPIAYGSQLGLGAVSAGVWLILLVLFYGLGWSLREEINFGHFGVMDVLLLLQPPISCLMMLSAVVAFSNRVNPRWLWLARAATVLAAVSTHSVIGNSLPAISILVIYSVVFGLLLARQPSPLAYGMQVGIGATVGGLSVVFFTTLATFSRMDARSNIALLGALEIAIFLNLLMIALALLGRSRLLREGKFYLGFLLALVAALGCLYPMFMLTGE